MRRGNQTRELKYSLVAPTPKLSYIKKVGPTEARQFPTTHNGKTSQKRKAGSATRKQGEKDDGHYNGCPIRYSNMR